MLSPFQVAMGQADQTIQGVMMSDWKIDGVLYPAVLDETPRIMDTLLSRDEPRVNGTERTLTLFQSSGYKPKINHIVQQGAKRYIVKAFSFQDDLIILQVE